MQSTGKSKAELRGDIGENCEGVVVVVVDP